MTAIPPNPPLWKLTTASIRAFLYAIPRRPRLRVLLAISILLAFSTIFIHWALFAFEMSILALGCILQPVGIGLAIRSHARRADRRLWWKLDRTVVAMAKRRRDGDWYLHGLCAYPRGSGGEAFTYIADQATDLEGTLHLNAGNQHLAEKYQQFGFQPDRTRPDGKMRPSRSGAVPMTRCA
jgi:hypothetical protein